MKLEGIFETNAVERVVYGKPAAEAVASEAERLAANRVFLLVSRTLETTTNEIAQIKSALGERFAGLYCGMPSHTPREAVIEAAAKARLAGADLIVTVGGGSITDAGKMVQLCLRHELRAPADLDPFYDRVDRDGTRVVMPIQAPQIRQIAVPTTLSGGEFGSGAGCTDSARKVKQLFRHSHLVPRVVVLDPALSVHTPAWLWLSTGVRAIDHAVETLCSSFATPQSDGPAMHALRLLGRGLKQTLSAPMNLAARLDCQIGVWAAMDHHQAAVPMGASHGIGHVLGGTCGVPHGHTSCVLLPAVLRWNKEANAHRQDLVSEAMDRAGEEAGDVLAAFIAELGMPGTLAEVGVDESRFRIVAENSMHDRYIYTNPRPISGPEDIMEILRLAA